jgi:glycosyltransferase involved in cell wall biosynthesis
VSSPSLLTVALPTCDGARHLRQALGGIKAQSGVEFDLVVSDDRSEDHTLAIVRDELGDRARVSVNSERLGLAGNWNRCVELSRTEWVAIFHQDDLMRPGHLAAHVAAFEANPTAGFVASAADVVDDEGCEVAESVVGRGGCGAEDRVYPAGGFVRELAVENPLRCSGVTLSAQAHAEVGGFDPSYRYVVDWDFWLRVARNRPVIWLARPTVAIRWHLASETHRFKTGSTDLEETDRLLKSLYRVEGPTLPDAGRIRRKADRRLARAYLNRAHEALKSGEAELAHRCLKQSIQLSPSIVGKIALDPKLAVQMATLATRPALAVRWFAARKSAK